MAAPLSNRMGHVQLEVPLVEDWTKWAAEENLDVRVIGYLNAFPSVIYQFDTRVKEKAFCTPRSWEFVSDLIKDIPTGDLAKIKLYASTLVGHGDAVKFTSFLKLRKDLKPIKYYFEHSDKATLPEKTDLLWALITSIVEYYRTHDDLTTFKQYIGLMKKFPEEYAVFTLKMTYSFDPKIQKKLEKVPEANKLAQKLWKFIM